MVKRKRQFVGHLITWNQMPSYKQIEYILNLSTNTIFEFDKHGVFNASQLTMLLNKYREKKTIMALVSNNKQYSINKRKKLPTEEQLIAINDKAIEEAFHVYRHWFKFKVPKAFRVVDSLQRYVCSKHGVKPGSYSFFVQQLENDFVPERLSILIEYGIPNTTIIKLAAIIPKEIKEDAIIDFIKENKKIFEDRLSEYELDRLADEL